MAVTKEMIDADGQILLDAQSLRNVDICLPKCFALVYEAFECSLSEHGRGGGGGREDGRHKKNDRCGWSNFVGRPLVMKHQQLADWLGWLARLAGWLDQWLASWLAGWLAG